MRDFKDLLQTTRNSTQQVAQQNQRAGACIDGIFDVISELQGAAERSDWPQVRRLAELILMDGLVYGVEGSPEDGSPSEHAMGTHFSETGDSMATPVQSAVNAISPGRRPFRHHRRRES